MERDGTEPQLDFAPERDAALEIQESFQSILDALDAARAELRAEGRSRRTASPPWSFDRHSEPAANGSRAVPAKVLSSPPATQPRPHIRGHNGWGLGPQAWFPLLRKAFSGPS